MPSHHPLTPRAHPSLLSLVIPALNEEEIIPLLRHRITAFIDGLPFAAEIIVVNDGSTDNTLELLLAWAKADRRIKVLGFARNFGHQAAVTAGLDVAAGDAVVIMDADLQDPPEVVLDMLREYRAGYDVVYGQRIAREGEKPFKRWSAWFFYRLMRVLARVDLPVDAGDFRLISKPCLEALRAMRETHRFLRGMVAWVGFAQTGVKFSRPPRAAGETKYPWHKMLHLAWSAAVSFSPAPIRMSLVAGLIVALGGFLYGLYAVTRVMLGLYVVPGWTSMLVANCLIGGGILISIGVVGEYIARIFEEVKQRPLYIVSVQANTDHSVGPASQAPERQTQHSAALRGAVFAVNSTTGCGPT